MFADKKIAFIGPGVMAEAMIAGLIRKGVAAGENMAARGPTQSAWSTWRALPDRGER